MKNKLLAILAVGLLAGPMSANASLIEPPTMIELLPRYDSFVDINNDGYVVGSTPGRAFGYDPHTGIQTFFSYSRGDYYSIGINNSGLALGWSNELPDASYYYSHYFTYDIATGTKTTLLSANSYDCYLGGDGYGCDIDDKGNVIPYEPYTGLSGAELLALLGPDSGWTDLLLYRMSDSGEWFLGVGTNALGERARFAANIRSVPEPGTLALFGLGLAGLGFSRRRKLN